MAEPANVLPETEQGHWPAQGEWTWDDYLRLPDDGNRYEIIEGELYVFGHEDSVRSEVLEGFETSVAPLFPPRKP